MVALDLRDRDIRQRSVVPKDKIKNITALVVGCGAVGRRVAKDLACMGVGILVLFDNDTVGVENLSPQQFPEKYIGGSKVYTLSTECQELNSGISIYAHNRRFTSGWIKQEYPRLYNEYLVVFPCVDTMDSRKHIYNSVRNVASAIFDPRMAGETMEVISTNDMEDPYYLSTIVPDSAAYLGSCTSRSLPYTAGIVAGLALHQFTRWLRDMPLDRHQSFNLLASELIIDE